MVEKEWCTKINFNFKVYFMTPDAGVVGLGRGHISHIVVIHV